MVMVANGGFCRGAGLQVLVEVTVALTSAQRIHTGFSGMCRIGGIRKNWKCSCRQCGDAFRRTRKGSVDINNKGRPCMRNSFRCKD